MNIAVNTNKSSFYFRYTYYFNYLYSIYRTLPNVNLGKIAAGFKKHNFHGLVIVGGFEV